MSIRKLVEIIPHQLRLELRNKSQTLVMCFKLFRLPKTKTEKQVSQAAACDGNYYQILVDGDNTNPPPGVLPI